MDPARRAAEDAARRAYGKLLAALAARFRDVAAAEDALAEAFRIALERWPTRGVPDRPEAWLATVARREMLGRLRRGRQAAAAVPALALLEEERRMGASHPDPRLRLMLVCAHPALDPSLHAPLMLQTVLGHDAAAIASAFLVAPATMSQRLVRAKARIRALGLVFADPAPDEIAARLSSVLDAIYAGFGLAWAAPGGRGGDFSDEAIWLARLVGALAPAEPEALGLLALMLHAQARRVARRDAQGGYVPLDEQDPRLWDGAMAAEAEGLIRRAAATGRAGRFQIEAAIQSVHAARALTGRTDHAALVGLYDLLCSVSPGIGAAIGRAAALGAHPGADRGSAAGLAALDSLPAERVRDHQPFWAVRADLLRRAGDAVAAREAYARAAGLAEDPTLRAFLLGRAATTA